MAGALTRMLGRSSDSGSFSPASLPTLLAWYDASLLTGTDGDAKTTWPDQKGSFNATATSTGPILKTGANGLNSKNVLQFDGTSACPLQISSALLSGATAGSYFVVAKKTLDPPTVSTKAGPWVDGFTDDTGVNKNSQHPWTDSLVYEHFGLGGAGTNQRLAIDPIPSLASWRIYSCHTWSPGSGDRMQLFLDGSGLATAGVTGTVTNYGTGVTRLIGVSNAGTTFMDGNIAEILFMSDQTTVSDRQKIEGYLAWKWGLSANLPFGHPYQSFAP